VAPRTVSRSVPSRQRTVIMREDHVEPSTCQRGRA
jgi:hypothetical protein